MPGKELAGVKITGLTRLRNDAAGNPRWLVQLDDGTEAATEDGAQCAYSIDNVDYRGVPLVVTMRRGKIARVRRQARPGRRAR
jgi:hypothetical protein